MNIINLLGLLASILTGKNLKRIYFEETLSSYGHSNHPWDPDMDLDVAQIIRRHGYPSESHVVATEDGYLLTVHRISGNKQGVKGGQPVLLVHGLSLCSADWVLNGNRSLAFYLADNGYDVWMSNTRGNTYSRAHLTLPVHSEQFWNFTWHEMAVKDMPAVIDFISKHTGKVGEIIFIGHSMGNTIGFVLAAMLPSVAQQLKLIVALAPTGYMNHMTSPIGWLFKHHNIAWFANYLGVTEFTPTNNKVLQLMAYDCLLSKFAESVCNGLLLFIAGFNNINFNISMLPKVTAHEPAGGSFKSIVHYAQLTENGKFQQFDYGPRINKVKYNSRAPPQYNISNMKAPFYFMYGLNDILADPVDVIRLAKQLPNLVGMFEVEDTTFGHTDFIFGTNAFEQAYVPLLEFMKKYH